MSAQWSNAIALLQAHVSHPLRGRCGGKRRQRNNGRFLQRRWRSATFNSSIIFSLNRDGIPVTTPMEPNACFSFRSCWPVLKFSQKLVSLRFSESCTFLRVLVGLTASYAIHRNFHQVFFFRDWSYSIGFNVRSIIKIASDVRWRQGGEGGVAGEKYGGRINIEMRSVEKNKMRGNAHGDKRLNRIAQSFDKETLNVSPGPRRWMAVRGFLRSSGCQSIAPRRSRSTTQSLSWSGFFQNPRNLSPYTRKDATRRKTKSIDTTPRGKRGTRRRVQAFQRSTDPEKPTAFLSNSLKHCMAIQSRQIKRTSPKPCDESVRIRRLAKGKK